MQFEIDTTARSGYLRARKGRVSATNELSNLVYADIDRNGEVLGIELIGREAFEGIEDLLATVVQVPTRLEYLIDDEHRLYVEAGVGQSSSAHDATAIQRHLAFARSIVTNGWNSDEIPDDALIILAEPGDPQRLDHLVDLADRQHPAFLQPLVEPPSRESGGNANSEAVPNPRRLSLLLEGDVLKRLDRIAAATGVDSASIAKRWIEEGIRNEMERDPRLAS